jgi:hypothetical protein
VPSPVLRGPGRPSWGFTPLQRHRRRDPHDPGLPHPARSVPGVSHPLDGFFSLRPCGLARSAAAPGVPLAKLFRTGRPLCVAAPLHPLVYGARQPRTLRNTRSESSADSKMLEPALPWSHGRGSRAPESPSEHITPASSQRLSPPQSPLALEPSASGRTMTRRTRHHRVFRQCGNQRIYWRPAAPMGFSLIRKTSWRLPVLYSCGYRHTRRSRMFSEVRDPRSPPGPVARAVRTTRVTRISKNHLLGQQSRR